MGRFFSFIDTPLKGRLIKQEAFWEVTIIKTILSNVAFAVVTVFTLFHIVNNYLLGIVPLIGLWIIFDYIKKFEQKTVDIKTKRIGAFSYFFTAIIGLILFEFGREFE
jgi:hypothetical protein